MVGSVKALVLHAVGDLRYEEVATPEVPEGWARVRVHACGVCGSDLPRCFVKGTYRFPTIPGHEFAGTVEAVNGDGPAPGTSVAVFPLIWCDRCEACQKGAYAQCEDYDYLGSRRDGAWAEFVIAPNRNLIPLPAGVHLDDACLTEPAAVALHALRRAGGVRLGEIVAIFGAGPIGLMAADWARLMGAGDVVLFDVAADKLALAADRGFPHAFDSRECDPRAVLEELSPGGAPLTLEAAGVPATTVAAIRATRRAGRCVLMGNPEAGVSLPSDLLSQAMRREISLLGTWNSTYSPAGTDDDWHPCLNAMAARRFTPATLVSHRIPLAQAAEFLLAMSRREVTTARVLLIPAPDSP